MRLRHNSFTTRAKARMSTEAAPPRRSAREAALAVAPLALHPSLCFHRDAEGPLQIFLPLRLGEPHLPPSALDAGEQERIAGHAAPGGDNSCQRHGLVEAPPPEPPAMERHGHDHVRVH